MRSRKPIVPVVIVVLLVAALIALILGHAGIAAVIVAGAFAFGVVILREAER